MRVNLANEKQRREFIRNYDVWGVWFYEPRLRISETKPRSWRSDHVTACGCPEQAMRHSGAVFERNKTFCARKDCFLSYYKCVLPDGSEIIVEEQTGIGRRSPRVVQALRYHLITPTGKYQLNGSSMEDMLRCLRSLPNEIDVLIGGYDEAI